MKRSNRRQATRLSSKRTTKEAPSLGAAIKRARLQKGITQLALAHQIGHQGDEAGAYICRLESNFYSPSVDTLARIAEALGVSVCALLP